MKRFTLLFGLVILSSFCLLSAQSIESSSITFKIKNAGLTVDGSFTGLTGKVSFDPTKYFSGKVDVSVPAKTIETGIDARDRHLKQKEYFHTENYPDIRITSRFFGKDKDEFRAYLTVHMKGKTGNVTMPFTATSQGSKVIIEGDFELNRRDFGIGGYSLIMGDEVKVHVKLVLSDSDKSQKLGVNTSSESDPMPQPEQTPLLKGILAHENE